MLPSLKALAGGEETTISSVRTRVAETENLTEEDIRELSPSGVQSVFTNRMSWAVLYLGRAGLVKRIRRGVWQLTLEGERLLANPPSRLDMNFLRKHPQYVSWRSGKARTGEDPTSSSEDAQDTPEEELERAARKFRETLETGILQRVQECSPQFLERVVINLLSAMGYGGGDSTMGRVTGRSGDGGIDGTIKEDALGLDEIYVQAKRYATGTSVGESDLRNFAGAIDAAGTTKGVFITTGRFTDAAKNYVMRSPKRIVLIDGEALAHLMVKHGVGVRTWASHEIKRIDEDYFDSDNPRSFQSLQLHKET